MAPKIEIREEAGSAARRDRGGQLSSPCTVGNYLGGSSVLGTEDGHIIYASSGRTLTCDTGGKPLYSVSLDSYRSGLVAVLSNNDGISLRIVENVGRSLVVRKVRTSHGDVVKAVHWVGKIEDTSNVRSMLIGTQSGNLFLVHISIRDTREIKLQHLWTTPGGTAIHGILAEKVADDMILMVSSAGKLFHDVVRVGANTNSISLENVVESPAINLIENLKCPPKLKFLGDTSGGLPPRTFLWVTVPGNLCVGEVEVSLSRSRDQRTTSKINYFQVLNVHTVEEIMDATLTPLHVLLLTGTEIFAFKRLTGALAFSTVLTPFLTAAQALSVLLAVGFMEEKASDGCRIFTEDGKLLETKIRDETYGADKDAISVKRFDLALSLATDKASVIEKQADSLAAQGDLTSAMKLYAKTDKPIEEVLLIVTRTCDDANMMYKLQIEYLIRRLDRIPKSSATQRAIISLLLVEMYSTQISMMKFAGRDLSLHQEFIDFLVDKKDDLSLKPAIKVMTSHGRYEEASFLASQKGMWKFSMEVYLKMTDYAKALDVFETGLPEMDEKQTADALMMAAPVVASCEPERLVQLWLREVGNPQLDESVLCGALLQAARFHGPDMRGKALQALRSFLEQVSAADSQNTKGDTQRDYRFRLLLRVYCELGEEGMVAAFVRKRRTSLSRVSLGLVLSELERAGFARSCVEVYRALGLHMHAVTLALKNGDLAGAENHAHEVARDSSIPENEDLAKAMWKHIACSDGVDSIAVVRQSRGCIRIEDVLPFTKFFHSDHIKDEVRESLSDSLRYHLKKGSEAQECATDLLTASEKIRERLATYRKVRDDSSTKSDPDYVRYPCGHGFRRAGFPVALSCPACDGMISIIEEPF